MNAFGVILMKNKPHKFQNTNESGKQTSRKPENQSQEHNAKKVSLGPNTKR